MTITYDSATDTLTIVLRDAPVRLNEEEKSGVILDYDAADCLIAIEVLDASSRVDRVDTPAAAGDLEAGREASRGGGMTWRGRRAVAVARYASGRIPGSGGRHGW